MDFINKFIHEEYLQAIGWTLLHSTWQIVAVSLLLWTLLKFTKSKSSNFRYFAGLASLLIISIASIWTFSLVLEIPQDPIGQNTGLLTNKALNITVTDNPHPYSVISETKPGLLDQIWYTRLEAFLPTLVNLWLLGALFYLVKLSGSLLDLKNLHKKHNQPVPDQLVKRVNSMIAAMEFYSKVKVLRSHLVHVPITYGIIKPVILIPTALLFNTSPGQLEAIIAHELAHIKRHDYLVNILQHCLEVFFFFHPCFWWINEVVRTERENACDDMVLRLGFNPKDLAYGLAEVAEQAHASTPEMALAATGPQNHTLNRIKRIMGLQPQQEKLSPLISLTMLVSLMISASLVMGAIPNEEKLLSNEYLLTNLKSKTIVKTWNFPCPDQLKGQNKGTKNGTNTNQHPTELTYSKEHIILHKDEEDVIEFLTNNHKQPLVKINKRAILKDHANSDTIPKTVIIDQSINVDDPMPVLELSPVPQMDVHIPPMPPMPPMTGMEFVPPLPEIQLEITEEASRINEIAMELAQMEMDTSIMDVQRKKELEQELKKVEAKMEVKAQVMEEKMAEWEKKHSKTMKEWESKMEEWNKKMEVKQAEWETAYAPKMEEFQKKMENWEKENEPKIKEFEQKMKAWEKRQRERQAEIE
ncbi:M48 family metalloprotease [Echinicola marina]|uniref:M56 family metallopeptidase n=1 Tax=Echinicola marina TaxID=2859768 RepID=UPI001CF6F7EB|nr:M56 family metallopeptidase [Echinicola marina]UCS95315.1 M48 family metalloprotease [Echinicola marina]